MDGFEFESRLSLLGLGGSSVGLEIFESWLKMICFFDSRWIWMGCQGGMSLNLDQACWT